jgi:hypothetical protein
MDLANGLSASEVSAPAACGIARLDTMVVNAASVATSNVSVMTVTVGASRDSALRA